MNLLKDNVVKLYFKYFFPTMCAALSTSVYILFDTIFIGQGVGSKGLTALNISLPIYSIYFGTGLLIGIGGSTLMSIEKGRERLDKANKIFTLSFILGLILATIYCIIGFVFLEEIALVLGATKEIMPFVKEYMVVVVIGTIPFVMGSVMAPFIRADKAPKKAMFTVIFSGFLNIILDYIFVFPLDMGMRGAAIATVFSYTISCLILLTHLLSKNNTLRFKKDFYKLSYITRIFKCGLPSLFIEVSLGFVIFIFNIQILKIIGDDGVTAYSIISNTGIIAVALFNGISQTIQPLISINMGANLKERATRLRNLGLFTALVIGVAFFILCIIFPEQIVRIFVNPNNEVLAIAINSIRTYSIAFIVMGINMVSGAYFQSIELAKESFIIAFCRGLLFVSICVFVLPLFIGINGVWLSVPIGELLTLIATVIFLKKNA
ncbi:MULTISPECIES: MATE family efflux transporter [unclassified Clostridium]|uniref:MATE family efflux transporter n=1 Tax=unclassified Clostridium TaxID=2614128 RepID=UPI001C8CE06D|nr:MULTISPECIES: MATE family efflux transporter [unclassified Clostridium]MBX9136807.1 MATE family efflux transporter [Clostridium sp. K12(2020)]MBX9143617.1 MATE family efflux transporter [Clostridium sp. K13]MDU2289624.1 MATE family efflux transporter [Clostridium celatum]